MTTVVAFVLIFGAIVFFHELGHFLVAKLAGVQVYEFSLGFGPALARTSRSDTLYAIRAIPLGGYVKLAGMDELESKDAVPDNDPRSFNSKSLPVRMATIAAGPIMNFVLAALLLATFFAIFSVPPTVMDIEAGFPAEQAGLQTEDHILAVNGQSVAVTDEIIDWIKEHPNQEIVLTVDRAGELLELPIVPMDKDGVGYIGVSIADRTRVPLLQAIRLGVLQTGRLTVELISALVNMVTGQIEAEIAGPIGIIQIVGQTAAQGIASLLLLAAVLNINLGLLNLLPVPVLDGGWLVILGIEGITGKPLAPEYRGIAQFVGLLLLITLMLFATFKDLTRIFV